MKDLGEAVTRHKFGVRGDPRSEGERAPSYPKTVETVTGEVVKVDRVTPIRGMSGGVHLVVKTDKRDVAVSLGPQWYLVNQDAKIEPKDRVEIRGSRVTVQGKPAIIAAEVKKGDETLKLRDEAGVPVWSGGRRR